MTYILLLEKRLTRQRAAILFVKVNADGFDLGAQRKPITENDLPDAERVVRLWLTGKLDEDIGSSVSWRLVEKTVLLAKKSITLQAELLLGSDSTAQTIETVRLGDVCIKCQQVKPESLGRTMFRYIDIESVDNVGLRITEAKCIAARGAPS